MKRIASLTMVAALAIGAAACSESEPTSSESQTQQTPPASCTGDGLLDCARASSIGAVVPDAPTAATGTPITVGMMNQENTPAGSFPELSIAANAAADFVNEQLGGIDGHPIEIDVCNTEFSAEGSTACAQRFVDDGVPLVLGGIDIFGNGIDVLNDNEIPFLGGIPISTQSAVLPNSFQWSGGTSGSTVAMADHAANVLNAKKVSILYSDFGSITESALAAQSVLQESDVEVQLVPFPVTSSDVSAPIQIAASNNPDVMMILVADTACKSAFDSLAAQEVQAQAMFTGACAATNITDALDVSKTNGVIFTTEVPVPAPGEGSPDGDLYAGVLEQYGNGLEPAGAGTVTFNSFMNTFMVLSELGADNISPESITTALEAKVDVPGFNSHNYTCNHEQFIGFPATCSPQQILVQMEDRVLVQISDWIDVGSIYRG